MGTTEHEKLDEAMAEIEKLRKENQIKAECCENLRRAFNEQLMKTQDKLTQELSQKEDELSAAKQMCEELMKNLRGKEAAIKALSAANERVRAESAEKMKNLEGQRDDVLLKLEMENGKLEEELKWKKEHFNHLLQAHERIRQQFREREKEWENEKATLLDELSTLQSGLDSQTRLSEDLRSRWQMCNQALAHEESRRKLLEIQVSETKTCFDSVSAEYEEAKSRIDNLSNERDKEIANLRNRLCTRETIYKETEYRFRKLEQENLELLASLKHFQEAGNGNGNSSVNKLRNKLKAKEAQWASELSVLSEDLKNKETLISELQNDLQSCHSLMLDLTLQNEETYLMLLVLKSHLSELSSMDLKSKENEQSISTLMTQLNHKNNALARAEKELEEERERVAMLSARVESMILSEDEEHVPLQMEVFALKEILREASAYQASLKNQVLKAESDLKEAQDALESANEELSETFYEGNEAEFELQIWRSVAERLKSRLDESLHMRRKVEASLFAQMDFEFELRQEKEREVNDLKQQIVLLNEELGKRETQDLEKELAWLRKELEGAILAQEEAERIHDEEKESFHNKIEDLQKLVRSLETEFENSITNFSSKLIQMQAHQTWETIKEAVVLKEIEIQEKNMIILELENDLSSSDREMLLHIFKKLSDRISQLSMEEMQLTQKLGRIMQNCDSNGGFMGIKRVNELFDPAKENLSICPSPTKILEAATLEERSPLRALNN